MLLSQCGLNDLVRIELRLLLPYSLKQLNVISDYLVTNLQIIGATQIAWFKKKKKKLLQKNKKQFSSMNQK